MLEYQTQEVSIQHGTFLNAPNFINIENIIIQHGIKRKATEINDKQETIY